MKDDKDTTMYEVTIPEYAQFEGIFGEEVKNEIKGKSVALSDALMAELIVTMRKLIKELSSLGDK